MAFADYVNLLKKRLKQSLKQSVSNNELCGILFDAIVNPLDLRNQHGDELFIDKSDISKIMNGKKKNPGRFTESRLG